MTSADALRRWHELVRGWLERSGIHLEPQDALVEQDSRFVVRELVQWRTATGAVGAPLEPTETWRVCTVADDLVTSIARCETPDEVPPA